MRKTRTPDPRICSIQEAMQILGGRWTVVIVRELLFGVRRFDEIVSNTGAPRDLVSRRLAELELSGLLTKERYSEHADRFEYIPTESCEALTGVLHALRAWGDTYAREPGDPNIDVFEHSCGANLDPKVICSSCEQELASRDIAMATDHRVSEVAA